jgi:AraC-like DNA-binding protein
MTFQFCELSAAKLERRLTTIGYATCHYENHEDSNLDEDLAIAHRVGFQTQSHFTRIFRQHTRMTPKQLRDALFLLNICDSEALP